MGRRVKAKRPYLEGLDKVMKRLNTKINNIEGGTLKGLIGGAIVIRRSMDDQSPKIPIDTANLRSSWFVVTSRGDTAEGQSPQFKGRGSGQMASDHNRVVDQNRSKAQGQRQPYVVMGFSANYAGWVHEMVGNIAWQRPGSGSKFFQAAIRRNFRPVLEEIRKNAQVK